MKEARSMLGKVAIVTGSSRGIGRVIAARLAQAGAQTVLAARTWDRLKAAADEIVATSPGAPNPHLVQTDLHKEDDIRLLIRSAVERFGKLDILVNNAAEFARGNVSDLPLEDWDRVMTTNLRAVFVACKYALPHLAQSGAGDIINISSTSGRKGDPTGSAYSASKFAMDGLSQSLFAEVRNSNIRVTVIYPSAVNTRERSLEPDGVRPDRLAAEDVADSVLFALSLPHGVTVKQIELWNTRQPK